MTLPMQYMQDWDEARHAREWCDYWLALPKDDTRLFNLTRDRWIRMFNAVTAITEGDVARTVTHDTDARALRA